MRKNVIRSYEALPSTAVSGTNVYVSTPTDISWLDQVAYHLLNVSGTPTGTFQAEVSNDPTAISNPAGAKWDVLGASIALTAGAFASPTSDNRMASFNNLPFRAIRMKYTNSSGTGNVKATLNAKMST